MFKQKSLCSLVAAAFLCVAAFISPVTASADSPDGLVLTVVPTPPTASLGENISYDYTITNTYNTAVSSLELTDDKFGPITLPATSLATGENVSMSFVYTVAIADFPGPIINNVTVIGIATDNTSLSTGATASVNLNPLTSSLSVSMSASAASAKVGDVITYTYIIANTGTADLTELALTDSRLGSVTLSSTDLAAGASLTASKTYTVLPADTSPLTSSATATATSATGEAVTATSPEVSMTITQAEPGDDITPPSDIRTKADILKERGVPGKGILHAPGLQKPFNWNFFGWGHNIEPKIRHHDNNNANDNDNNNSGVEQGKGNGNWHGKGRGK